MVNKKLTSQLEYNEIQRQDEIKWLKGMVERLEESRKYVSEKHKHKYYLKQFTNYYDTLLALFNARLDVKLDDTKLTLSTGRKS